jgi:3-hydroxyisobutyrate dehydrogenase
MSTQTTKVGFVGLGDMGGAIAQRIIDAGFPTTLWARKSTSLKPYADSGANFAENLLDMGKECDVVGVCVFSDKDVKQVVLGEGDGLLYGMAPGGVIAVHSTITMETCQELESLGAERGVFVIDAPVSGARQGAEQGTLCIMVGGSQDGFDRAQPVFSSYGKTIERLGAIGSGQRAKVLNNVLCFVHLATASIAFEVANKLDLNPDELKKVLLNGSGSSSAMGYLVHQLEVDPKFAAHAITMIEKDSELYQELCKQRGISPTALDELAEASYEMIGKLAKNTR